jgi:hypothetical protein
LSEGLYVVEQFDAESQWYLDHPAKEWVERMAPERAVAIRMAANVAELVLPEWRTARPQDTVPLRAVEAALNDPTGEDAGLRQHAKALAKACGESRRRSMGYEHRIAEAARALANAAAASTEAAAMEAVAEALDKMEEHLLYRLAVAGVYGMEAEVRGQMLRQALAM